jgi:acetyl-CoA acetyltransferase
MFENVFIPYGGYYASPFCKWQGAFQNVNAIELGAATAKRWFEARGIDQAAELDYLYMGITVGQPRVFFGATWAAHLMGAPGIPGNTIMHACATSTTTVYNAALAVETGNLETAYCLMLDRTSNGPHTVWPNPSVPAARSLPRTGTWTTSTATRRPAAA